MIIEKIKEKIKKFLETNDNESITIQNLGDRAKAVLRGKFIAVNIYIVRKEKSHIKKLNLYLRELEKEEQPKLKLTK